MYAGLQFRFSADVGRLVREQKAALALSPEYPRRDGGSVATVPSSWHPLLSSCFAHLDRDNCNLAT